MAAGFELAQAHASIGAEIDKKSWSKAEKGVGGRVAGLGKGIAKGLAVGVAALAGVGAAAFKSVVDVGNLADELLDMSARTGVSTEALQEWRFVANQAGVDQDFFAKGVDKTNKNMIKLTEGTGPAGEAFKELGLSVHDANGELKSGEQILEEQMAALAAIEDPAERARLGTQMFGGEWANIAPVVDQGTEAMAEQRAEAERLGLVMSEDQLNAANDFRMAWDSVKTQMSGVKNIVAASLAPAFERLVSWFGDTALPVIREGAERFSELWSVFDDGEGFVDGLMNVFSELTGGDGIGSIFEKVGEVVQNAFDNIVEWLADDGLEMIFKMLIDGRDRLIKAGMKLFPALIEAVQKTIPILIRTLRDLIPEIVSFLVGAVPMLLKAALDLFRSLLDALVEIIPMVIDLIINDLIPTLLDAIIDVVPKLLDAALEMFTSLIDALVEIIPPLLKTLTGDLIPQLLKTVLKMIPKLLDTAVKLFLSLIDAVVKILPDLIKAITNLLPKIITALLDMIPKLIPQAIKLFLSLVEGVIGALPEIIKAIVGRNGLIPAVIGALIDAIPQIVAAGGELLSGLFGSITEFRWSGIWDGLVAAFKGAINGLIRMWNDFELKLGPVDMGIFGQLGPWTIRTPNVPYLAEGGLITDPTMAMIGEGRQDEAVLPLDRVAPMFKDAMIEALQEVGGMGRNVSQSFTLSENRLNDPSFIEMERRQRWAMKTAGI